MRVGRLILVVATLVTILVFPLLIKDAIQALRLPSAYAAPNVFDSSGRVYQNGNNNDNGNNNNNGNNNDNRGGNNDDDDNDNRNGNNDNDDESDNEGEDNGNDNVECFANMNSNEEVPCDFDNDNDRAPAPAPAAAPAPSGGTSSSLDRCFGAGETGGLFLDAPDFDVTVTVVNPLGSDTRLSLGTVDPASVPAVPAGSTLLDSAVWHLDARVGCGGGSVGMLPAAVNNGFFYSVSANKAKLQIVRLENGAWVEVTTVPDPSKQYISATIQNAGTYAVIQKP